MEVLATHIHPADERHLVARHDQVAAARADDAPGKPVCANAAVAPAQAEPGVATEEPRLAYAVDVALRLVFGDGVDDDDVAVGATNHEAVLGEDGVAAATQWAERVARLGNDGEREVGGALAGVGDAMAEMVRVHGGS